MGFDDLAESASYVESALGLLADLYGDLAAARPDITIRRIGDTLALIHAEARRLKRGVDGLEAVRAPIAPAGRPSPATAPRLALTA